jgi:hypothetical protein
MKAFLLVLFLTAGLSGPGLGGRTDHGLPRDRRRRRGFERDRPGKRSPSPSKGKRSGGASSRAPSPRCTGTRDGKTERVAFALESATLDGRKVPASTSTTGRDTEIRLGDPDVLLSHESHSTRSHTAFRDR